MTDHTPSGQQAVEILPCPFCGGSALIIRCPPERDGQKTLHRPQCDQCGADCGGCDTPSEAIALWNRRTAAPTAPSTAAGEREAIERDAARYRHLRAVAIRNDGGPSWPGPGVPAIAVPQDHHSGYFVNEEDADMHVDAAMEAAATAAALATPPAQEVEEETETLENLIDAAIGARTAPPWQEQAAQIRRDALEEACNTLEAERLPFSAGIVRALIPNERKGG